MFESVIKGKEPALLVSQFRSNPVTASSAFPKSIHCPTGFRELRFTLSTRTVNPAIRPRDIMMKKGQATDKRNKIDRAERLQTETRIERRETRAL